MTRPSLAGIEQRAAAATPGPWEATQDKCWGEKYPSLSIQRVSEYTDYDPAHAGCEPLDAEDAEFIAAARTAVPALTAAVRDVLKVAAPHWEWATRRETKFGRPASDASCVCEVCKIVRALAAHLDLTDPEGDPT